MPYARTYFRDQITLNDAFRTRLQLSSAPPGAILIAARALVLDGPFDLTGRDLVLLADRFETTPTGKVTLDGGSITPRLTVAAREFAGLTATARGAVGAAGAPGRPGRPGKPGRNASRPFKPGGPGGPGGAGGNGGTGKVGGVGGTISVMFVTDLAPGGFDQAGLSVPGGPGGEGGPGGPGGPGGMGGFGEPEGRPGADGPDGGPGLPGPDGPAGTIEVTQVGAEEFFPAITPLADSWAAYRLRVGEYFFRAANPVVPPRDTFLALALGELTAVTRLDPANATAEVLRQRILAGHNVLGQARDLDVIPDFDHYERALTDYGPLVLSLFQTATTLLSGNLTLDQLRQSLTREVAHLGALESILAVDRAAAARGVQAADADQQFAIRSFAANQQGIQARKQALEAKTFGWTDLVGVTAFAALTAVITLATGGGAAAIAAAYLPQVLVQLAGDKVGPFSSAEAAALLNDSLGLKGLLKENAEGVEVGKLVLSYSKLLADVNASDGDEELKRLLRESVELTHAKLVSALRADQASLTLAAADLRLAQAQADRALAQSQLDGLTTDVDYLERVGLTLMANARGFMEVLMRYAFFAARSVEIYTLDDLSAEIFFDYGHVHPDLEQDHHDGLLPLAQLLGAYSTSWSRFVGILGYRARYDAHLASGDRVLDKVFVSVTDPDALAGFRDTLSLQVVVDLADLPAARREARAAYVLLSLVGATAAVPTVSVLVEHGGTSQSVRVDGSEAVQVLQPRATVVQTARTPLTFTGAHAGKDPSELSFWGRGVATSWTVRIEQDEIIRRNVDLSALSAIEIEIGYEAFLA